MIPALREPLLLNRRYKVLYGGRGCVHPDTLLETPSGKVKISDFCGGELYSYQDGRIVKSFAGAAYECDEQQLYIVKLKYGREIHVTDEHKFLSPSGWKMTKELSVSDSICVYSCSLESELLQFFSFPLLTTLGICPSKLLEDARRLTEKLEDCQDDYSLCHRQYDPQPCLLYTSPSPRDGLLSRMPSSA